MGIVRGGFHAVRLDVHPGVRAVALTAVGRARPRHPRVAADSVPHADAAANAAAAGLLVHALTDRAAYLLLAATATGCTSTIARSAMPESGRLLDDLRAAGIAAVVSGAGPSVLALSLADGACRLAAAGFRRGGDHGVRVWRPIGRGRPWSGPDQIGDTLTDSC